MSKRGNRSRAAAAAKRKRAIDAVLDDEVTEEQARAAWEAASARVNMTEVLRIPDRHALIVADAHMPAHRALQLRQMDSIARAMVAGENEAILEALPGLPERVAAERAKMAES